MSRVETADVTAMLKDDEIKIETYRLKNGGMVYRATHLPTGALVGPSLTD